MKINEPLPEDKVIEILTKDPLLAFSIYTSSQVRFLETIAQKIEDALDGGISENGVVSSCFTEVYGLFWLWILGSYEVVRTISQHRNCFDQSLHQGISEIKKHIKLIRIPFAKQELPKWSRNEETRPVYAELTVREIDFESKDFVYSIADKPVSIKSSIHAFRTFISSINPSLIHKTIPTGGHIETGA